MLYFRLYVYYHMVFVFLFLAYCTWYNNVSPTKLLQMALFPFFLMD